MIDFDAQVLGPAMDAFACPAVLTPIASQPGQPAYPVRGIFALKGADIADETAGPLRADNYTFGVRASEFPFLVARGDLLSDIRCSSFARFLDGRTFTIEDTGDDGQGGQVWVLKEAIPEDDP